MSMYSDASGPQAHGRTSPLRIDASTILALFVIAALVVVAGLHFAFKASAGVGVSR